MADSRLKVLQRHLVSQPPSPPVFTTCHTAAVSTPHQDGTTLPHWDRAPLPHRDRAPLPHQDGTPLPHQETSCYRYTRNGNGLLTPAQRDFYEQNGYLVIPKLVPEYLLDQFSNRFIDIVENRVRTFKMTKMKDVSIKGQPGVTGERSVNKIQDFVWDEVLSQHCVLPQILDYVESVIGEDIMAMHVMLINKPPDTGSLSSRHPMHQDMHYFPFRPADKIVCAWTAMEKIDEDNGCLFMLPGSHKLQLEKHEYPEWESGVNKMYHGVRGFNHLPKTFLHMDKGDTVFFHPIVLHGSGPNLTNRFRKAISCHYAASECHYIDVMGTSQENLAKEVENNINRKGVTGLSFKEFWKLRSRLVRGNEITL